MAAEQGAQKQKPNRDAIAEALPNRFGHHKRDLVIWRMSERGYTLREIGEAVGCHYSTVCRVVERMDYQVERQIQCQQEGEARLTVLVERSDDVKEVEDSTVSDAHDNIEAERIQRLFEDQVSWGRRQKSRQE